jgi:hypothetical protein
MTPKQIYQQLVELHGTQQDAELRRCPLLALLGLLER